MTQVARILSNGQIPPLQVAVLAVELHGLDGAIGVEIVVEVAPDVIHDGTGVHRKEIEQGLSDGGIDPKGDVDIGRAPLLIGHGRRWMLTWWEALYFRRTKRKKVRHLW